MSEAGFNISFTDTSGHTGRGEIQLNEFFERFDSSFEYWPSNVYESQWKEGVQRIVEGEKKSALVTAMYPPESANFIVWWIMYHDGDNVIFQNHLLMLEMAKQQFEVSKLYSYIPDYSEGEDEEFPVSEWIVAMDSLKRFCGC